MSDATPYVCSVCGTSPASLRAKRDGTPALPFRWTRTESGDLLCRECKPAVDARNYAYDCRRPEGADAALVDDQMRRAHRYRNALVELERSRRGRTDAVLLARWPDLAALEHQAADLDARVEKALTTVRQGNSVARRKEGGTAEQLAELTALRAELRAVRLRRKAARDQAFADPSTRSDLASVEEWAGAEAKRLRAECGLYWGTYCTVEAAAKSFRSGAPPRFLPFRGDGHIAVQLQGGLPVADAMGGQDRRLRIEVLSGGRPDRPLAVAWMRAGSDDQGGPIWVRVRFRLHRPLPTGSRVKWAHLIRTRTATNNRWRLVFAVEGGARRQDQADAGRVGVDVGWRIMGDGSLRLASWVGTDGARGELRLPADTVSRWRRAEEITSSRRTLFNAMVLALLTWLRDHAHPDWLRDATATLAQWKSENRLAALVLRWRRERFAGDESIMGGWEDWQAVRQASGTTVYHQVVKAAALAGNLHAWQIWDRHLYEYADGTRRRAVRQREYLARTCAADLRRRYHTVAVESVNWRDQVLTIPDADQDTEAGYQRLYHRMAAPGRLVQLLAETAAQLVRVDAAHTTQRCHVCGQCCDFDAAAQLVHQCEHCGATWDQDENAARNILAAASGEAVNQTPDPARGPEGDAPPTATTTGAVRPIAAKARKGRPLAAARPDAGPPGG